MVAVLALCRRLVFFVVIVVSFAELIPEEFFEHGRSFAECGECGCSGSSGSSKCCIVSGAKEDKGTRYGEASKVIRMPDPFGSDLGDVETDQTRWSDFALGFKSWLFYADPKFEAELEYVETNNKTEVKLAGMSEDSKARSLQLFSILSGLLRGRPLRILRGLVDRNGIELWRQLNLQYAPKTKGRAFSILDAYMNYPSFDKSRSLLEHIQLLERVRTEYRKAS